MRSRFWVWLPPPRSLLPYLGLGLAASAGFWALDAAFDAIVLDAGRGWFTHALDPTLHQVVLRLVVAGGLVTAAVLAGLIRLNYLRVRAVLDHAGAALAVLDADGDVRHVNRPWAEEPEGPGLLCARPGDSCLETAREVASRRIGLRFRRVAENLEAVIEGESEGFVETFPWETSSSGTRWFQTAARRFEAPWPEIVVTQHEVTEKKRLEVELEHRSEHDPVTELPNRSVLQERIRGALERRAEGGEEIALLLVDLDDFGRVNDTYGHTAGDRVLQTLARRLPQELRSVDLIARFGGDEFAVLVEHLEDEDDATSVVARIRRLLERPVEVDGERMKFTASIGLAAASFLPAAAEADPAELLLRVAQTALRRAQEEGRDRTTISRYRPARDDGSLTYLRRKRGLADALSAGDVFPVYLPIVDASERWVGLEALARWEHPERGLLPPSAFLPLAEETGLVRDLGDVILRRAAREVAGALGNRLAGPGRLWVNLSAREFDDPDLERRIRETLRDAGLPADRLVLEITETTVLQRLDAVADLSSRFKVAVDDFGTGHASLQYLRDLEVEILKLDRSFVTDLPDDEEARALARSVARLGADLGLTTVAEGVESGAHWEAVRELGFDLAQGFHFGRPMSAARIRS